jgi:hypothetical protein
VIVCNNAATPGQRKKAEMSMCPTQFDKNHERDAIDSIKRYSKEETSYGGALDVLDMTSPRQNKRDQNYHDTNNAKEGAQLATAFERDGDVHSK